MFLNFDGVTLTKGNCNDAPTNCVDYVTTDQTVVPPFLNGNADRAADIAAIVQVVNDALAPYSIEIVTSRPASGSYDMIVVGGDPSLVGGSAGLLGLAPGNCTPRTNLVSMEFDHGYTAPYVYANLMLSDIAVFAGLSASTDPGDCMCRVAMGCAISPTKVCTFARTGNVDPTVSCGRVSPQDEQAELDTAYECR